MGIGYNTSKKQKLYKYIFVKTSYSTTQRTACTFCNTEGHTIRTCYVKNSVKRELKTKWVANKNSINIHGPNKIWVPKTNV